MQNLSSLVDKVISRMTDKGLVMIEISARHVHLSQPDVERLFGPGYQLVPVRPLSQPGQYLAKERVSLIGPLGSIHNVGILGPARKDSQVEIVGTDVRKLGIETPYRLSGDIQNTPGITLAAGSNQIDIPQGLIIAKRHIHMLPEDAERHRVKHGDKVEVRVLSERPLIFEDTEIRVSKESFFVMHIDTEEANAAGIIRSGFGVIRRN